MSAHLSPRLLQILVAAALVVALPTATARAADDEPIRVGYLFSDGQMPGTVAAYRQLIEERPDLRDRVELQFLTESLFEDQEAARLGEVDVLVLDIMNDQLMKRWNERHEKDLIAEVQRDGVVLGVGLGLLPIEHYVDQGVTYDETAHAFWQSSGPRNTAGLLQIALRNAGVADLEIPKPQIAPDFGWYLPSTGGGEFYDSWGEFLTAQRAREAAGLGKPRIGVGFYRATFTGGDTATLDAVIAEVERQGAVAVPFFGYPGHVALREMLIDEHGAARVDAVLSFLFRFGQPESSESLAKLDVPVFNLVNLYGRTEQQWLASDTGLSPFEGTFQVAAPEFAGLLAPSVVGSRERTMDPVTGLRLVVTNPIEERIQTTVRRALRWVDLRNADNADKRLALLYYNYPPGKAGIGASYLNVAASIGRILEHLRDAGYDVGEAPTDAETLIELMQQARNVSATTPGELDQLIADNDPARVSPQRYREWLEELHPALRGAIERDWGEVTPEQPMVSTDGELLIPRLEFGNVVLLPQPARGWGEELEQLYHADDLAPPPQYVAAYRWLREEFAADALLHIGTHGTLEWLDGRAIGLSADDAPDALIGDLPHLYVYNVDVVGEGLVARRRTAAAIVDHMTPPFTNTGLYAELAELREKIDDHHLNLSKNPELAAIYSDEIRKRVADLGIVDDLGFDPDKKGMLSHREMHRVQDYLIELEGQSIPYGLHTFGVVPDAQARASTVKAIVETDRSLLPTAADVLAGEMERRIVASGPRELGNLEHGLDGGYLPGGNGGEPIRNPDVYPTGKNFYGIDPDKVPKKEAWKLGVQLADEMLEQHLEKNGRYPEKVAFVIWGDETMRHEGVVESQVFHLLGTKPVWDDRGNLVDVAVVPAAQLGRPRIDIVISSAAEGMFHNVTRMMDRAVQKVKVIEEADNLVRRNYLSTRNTLLDKGYSEKQADLQASVRIFDEAPGVLNLNTSRIAAASGSWDTDAGMANDYFRKMGHGYGNGFWGEPMEDAFRLALGGTEQIVHSSSTMLYGALDSDDFFMYVGGLATAVRSIDGESPEMVVTNTRDPSKPEMTGMETFIGREFRSRYVNPKWITGMQKEGYAGAGEMRNFVEYLWGWEATAANVIDEAMWQDVFEVYVEDEYDLGLEDFFEQASPFARQDMVSRLIETVRKDGWQADEATEERLLEEYLESVARHGISCVAHTCASPRFVQHVDERATELQVPTGLIEGFRAAVEQATGRSITEAAVEMEQFIEENEQRIAQRQETARTGRAPSEVEGYRMEDVSSSDPSQITSTGSGSGPATTLGLGALLVATLVWRRRALRV